MVLEEHLLSYPAEKIRLVSFMDLRSIDFSFQKIQSTVLVPVKLVLTCSSEQREGSSALE
jgi:hypothetical protein